MLCRPDLLWVAGSLRLRKSEASRGFGLKLGLESLQELLATKGHAYSLGRASLTSSEDEVQDLHRTCPEVISR